MGSVTTPSLPGQPGNTVTVTPPVLQPTPGGGTSFDPTVTYQLAANDAAYLVAYAYAESVLNYLLAVENWKQNGVQQQANGLPVSPPPQPPPGYVPPSAPPPPPTPVQGIQTVVHAIDQWGQYPAPGDNNPAGTVISNPFVPGGRLVKVVQATPFGNSMWWVAA